MLRPWAKRVVAVVVACLFVAVCVLIGSSIVGINTTWPAPERTMHCQGDVLSVQGSDEATFAVVDAEILGAQAAEERFPESFSAVYGQVVDQGADIRVVEVTLHIENASTEELALSRLYASYIDIAPSYANGVDLMLTGEYYGHEMPESVPAGEKMDLTLVFSVMSIAFPEKEWDSIDGREFSYVYSLWPNDERVALSILEG